MAASDGRALVDDAHVTRPRRQLDGALTAHHVQHQVGEDDPATTNKGGEVQKGVSESSKSKHISYITKCRFGLRNQNIENLSNRLGRVNGATIQVHPSQDRGDGRLCPAALTHLPMGKGSLLRLAFWHMNVDSGWRAKKP